MAPRSNTRSRRDLALWVGTIALAVVATAIAWTAGARLGAALTLGVAITIAVVLGALIREALTRQPTGGPEKSAPAPRAPTRGRAKPRKR